MREKRANGLPDQAGRVRQRTKKSRTIHGRAVSNRLTLCVDALCQVPHAQALFGLSPRCEAPIKQHCLIGVAHIAPLVAVYLLVYALVRLAPDRLHPMPADLAQRGSASAREVAALRTFKGRRCGPVTQIGMKRVEAALFAHDAPS
jgi:hypothetical protein